MVAVVRNPPFAVLAVHADDLARLHPGLEATHWMLVIWVWASSVDSRRCTARICTVNASC